MTSFYQNNFLMSLKESLTITYDPINQHNLHLFSRVKKNATRRKCPRKN